MSKTAVVTGANQGLGLALVKGLAQRLSGNDTVYLTARSPERGQAALELIGQSRACVEIARLDVTEPASIAAFTGHLEAQHGGVDIVASNAAARISKDTPQAEQVREFVATNNHGSKDLFVALRTLLKPQANYVMVASSFGQLRNLPPSLHSLFDTDSLTLEQVEANLDQYVTAVEAGTANQDGWPDWINVPSKVGQVATARIAARDFVRDRPEDDIRINAVCPGLLDTDASRPWFENMDHALTPEQGAVPILDLLLSSPANNGPSGQLMQFGKQLPWL